MMGIVKEAGALEIAKKQEALSRSPTYNHNRNPEGQVV